MPRSPIGDRLSGPLAPVTPFRVLLVEDCAADAELILDVLRREGFDPQSERVETERTADQLASRVRGVLDECRLQSV